MSLYFLKLLWGLVCVAILRAEAELVDVLDYQDYMLNKIVNSEENTAQGELTDAGRKSKKIQNKVEYMK